MKQKLTILLTGLILFSLSTFGRGAQEEVTRTISKNFSVAENPGLEINNKFGSITVNIWDKSEINFMIEIIGKGNKASIAESMANRGSVEFSQKGNKVYAKTVYDEFSGKYNNASTTINYTVNVPESVYLSIICKYGNARIESLIRDFSADIKYGNLNTGNLLGEKNSIKIKYGDVSTEQVSSLNLDMGFSNAKIEKVEKLRVSSEFSSLKASEINEMTLNSKYDRFTIEEIGTIKISTAYSTFQIKNLKQKFEATDFKFGKLSINYVDSNFQAISVNAAYSGITIRFDKTCSFKADLSTSYASIKTGDMQFSNVTFSGTQDHHSQAIKGTTGPKQNPEAYVKISNAYANIVLSKLE
ncbi:hypothetical protein LJC12_00555 [Odoribacter sp. OttesenSCG-928-J03]|nr:hypothetical protein [Odoribacter sp. OttesenSCG-928-J03]MDL2283365.1 hypothetical protein [Odoribacter sp. OttesenSCG-928-G04]